MNLLGVYTVQVLFDFSSYESSRPLEQKKMLLGALLKGVKRVFQELSIPYSLIEDVVNEIEKNDYENSWEWKRKKIQSTIFSIQVEHQLDKVDLFWKIEQKDKSIRQLIQSYPALLMRWTMGLSLVNWKQKVTSYICWIKRMRL